MDAWTKLHGVIACASILLAASCSQHRPENLEALYSCDDFEVYPSRLVSDDLTLEVLDDDIVVNRRMIAYRRPINRPVAGQLSMWGTDTLFCDIFNRAPAISAPEPYNCLTPYEEYLYRAIVEPDSIIGQYGRSVGSPHQASVLGLSWPVISSDAMMLLTAREGALAMGADDMLAHLADASEALLKADRKYCFDPQSHLFTGMPAELIAGDLHTGFNAADMGAAMTLSANVTRLQLMRFVADRHGDAAANRAADSLQIAIETLLWCPEAQCFSAMLCRRPYPIAAPFADNLSQAVAVATGSFAEAAANNLIARTPIASTHIPPFSPSPAGITSDSHREALVDAWWVVASARTHNEDAMSLALASLIRRAADDDAALDCFRGAMLRGLAGISLTEDGIAFAPFIPKALDGEIVFSDLPYGEAQLDVSISGYGDIVATFALDGEALQNPLIAKGLKGHHKVAIKLVGFSKPSRSTNICPVVTLPSSPEMTVDGRTLEITAPEESETTKVFIDGVLWESTGSSRYSLPKSPVICVNAESVDADGYAGIPSPTRYCIAPSDSISIPIASVASTGSRVLKGTHRDRKYVESTRYKNSRIDISFTSPQEGRYLVMLDYLEGLGIVNPERRYALRSLSVNNSFAGLFILPQLSPDNWRYDIDWVTRQGRSLPIEVTLREGENKLSIEYYAPETATFDHDTNILIPTSLLLVNLR